MFIEQSIKCIHVYKVEEQIHSKKPLDFQKSLTNSASKKQSELSEKCINCLRNPQTITKELLQLQKLIGIANFLGLAKKSCTNLHYSKLETTKWVNDQKVHKRNHKVGSKKWKWNLFTNLWCKKRVLNEKKECECFVLNLCSSTSQLHTFAGITRGNLKVVTKNKIQNNVNGGIQSAALQWIYFKFITTFHFKGRCFQKECLMLKLKTFSVFLRVLCCQYNYTRRTYTFIGSIRWKNVKLNLI